MNINQEVCRFSIGGKDEESYQQVYNGRHQYRNFGSRFHLFQLLHLLIYDRTKCKEVFVALLPSFLATKAFWLTLASLGSCDLADVSYGGYTHDKDVVDESVATIRSFGLFRYSETSPFPSDSSTGVSSSSSSINFPWQDSPTYYSLDLSRENETKLESIVDNVMERIHSCHKMDRHFFILDGNFRTARTAGAIALTLGFFVVLITWVQMCKPISGSLWKITVISVLLCTLLEGLTFLIFHASFCSGEIEHSSPFTFVADGTIFETDGINCKIARGSGATIAACAFWFLAAVTIFLLVPHGTISTNSIPYNGSNGRHEHLHFTTDDDSFTMDEYDNSTNEGEGGRPFSDLVINTSSTWYQFPIPHI
jgi:hypothetical protein